VVSSIRSEHFGTVTDLEDALAVRRRQSGNELVATNPAPDVRGSQPYGAASRTMMGRDNESSTTDAGCTTDTLARRLEFPALSPLAADNVSALRVPPDSPDSLGTDTDPLDGFAEPPLPTPATR
jgi:hypothetical protein